MHFVVLFCWKHFFSTWPM